MLDIVLEYWKLLNICFIIGKNFGLLDLHVAVKGIISSFWVTFDCLKISKDFSLVFNIVASINDLGYFHWQCFFQFFKTFFFYIFTMVQILLARENGILIKQSHGWFHVNGTYRFESAGLL